MRILIIKNREDPQWGYIDNNPEAMKKIVGGEDILIIPTLIKDTVIVADRDAKLKHRPYNFDTEKEIVVGDVFCVGMRGDVFEDITDDQARAILAVYMPDSPSRSFYKQLFSKEK